MQPNTSQMGIINYEKSNLEVNQRDGCGFNNEVTNLEIVTRTQNMTLTLTVTHTLTLTLVSRHAHASVTVI
jgi:hypothetical protein